MIGKHLRISLLALLALFGLGACGGSGSTAGGGIGGTGISYGTVTDFGSIWVNGVRFDTTGTTIVKDDVVVSETELRRGMTVEVSGFMYYSTPTGTASTVTVEEAVRGPVELKDGTASAGTLVVLGQTVHVDDTTLIDDNVCALGEACATAGERFAAIGAGDLLEVHGHRRADGTIAATFIESKTAPIVFTVRGTVAAHSAAAQTFTIGALTVDYGSGSADIGDMPVPSGNNWDGLFVEVKGDCATTPVCGTLTATKVGPEGLAVADAARAEIEGFVTSGTAADFTIGDQRVVTNGATVFAGGLPEEIVVGTKLEVEGTLAGGVLTATKVKFKDNVKLESNASASATTITLEGLPGITVTANAFTRIDSDTGATTSNLAPLNGRNVRIRGRASGTSAVIATEIDDRGSADGNADVFLQGFVPSSGVSDPTLTILGVEVNTEQLVNVQFEDVNDAPIGRAAFFNALTANGGLVKAKGQLPAVNALAAGPLEEIELED